MHEKPATARRYRLLAQEARVIAQGILDQEERKTLLQIANAFEKVALEQDPWEGYLKMANRPSNSAERTNRKSRRSLN